MPPFQADHAAHPDATARFAAREADWRNGAVIYQVLLDRFAPAANLAAALTTLAMVGACTSVAPVAPPGVTGLSTTGACSTAPWGDNPPFLRGTMNQWQADEASEFVWRCNAYQLNVQLSGEHRFMIADDSWRDDTILANARFFKNDISAVPKVRAGSGGGG